MKNLTLIFAIAAALTLTVSAQTPSLSPLGSAPSGMSILTDGLTLNLRQPIIKNRVHGIKMWPSAVHTNKTLAAVVYVVESMRPNKAVSYKDIFGTAWYVFALRDRGCRRCWLLRVG